MNSDFTLELMDGTKKDIVAYEAKVESGAVVFYEYKRPYQGWKEELLQSQAFGVGAWRSFYNHGRVTAITHESETK